MDCISHVIVYGLADPNTLLDHKSSNNRNTGMMNTQLGKKQLETVMV